MSVVDKDCDTVIEQMKNDYAQGVISLHLLEEYIENRLQGRTPVDKDGFPLYYEYDMLNNTGLYYL
jgi:hypothetical protein